MINRALWIGRSSVFVFAIVLSIAVVSAGGRPSCATEPMRVLTQAQIEEAIAWGIRGDARPYDLPASGSTVGFVFTPFVRVALWAKTVSRSDRTAAPRDIPAAILEPLVIIALRWYPPTQDEESRGIDALRGTPFSTVVVPAGQMAESSARIAPAWTDHDLSRLRPFGGEDFVSNDVVVVAGYEPDALKPGFDVVVFTIDKRDFPRSGRHRACRLTPDLIAHWR